MKHQHLTQQPSQVTCHTHRLNSPDVWHSRERLVSTKCLLVRPEYSGWSKYRVTLSIAKGGSADAVVSPAPVTKTLDDLQRVLHEKPPDSVFLLEVIVTRRMLGM